MKMFLPKIDIWVVQHVLSSTQKHKCMHTHTGHVILLTHWGRVTHICVDNLIIIGLDNGSSPAWRQAIIWTNAGILLIGPLGTNFSEILIGIQTFSFKKMHLKMLSAKWHPFCLSLNVLIMQVLFYAGLTAVILLPTNALAPDSVNPLRAKFFRGNLNIYLHFMSFLHIDLTQVLKTLPQVREEPTHSI